MGSSEPSSEGSTFHVDVSEITPPTKHDHKDSRLCLLPHPPQETPATIDIDKIVKEFVVDRHTCKIGFGNKELLPCTFCEAKAQIADLITEKENRARLSEMQLAHEAWTTSSLVDHMNKRLSELKTTLKSKGKND